MTFDFKRGDINFSDVQEEYEAPTNFASAIRQRKPPVHHLSVARKRMVVVKPRSLAKKWIVEEDGVPVAATLKRLTEQMDVKYGHMSTLEPTLFSEEYMAVIGLGPRVVPLLLADLKAGHTPWFWALKAITREDVGSTVQAGNFRELKNAWLAWGLDKGLL